jgi:syntaxin 16
MIKPEQQNSQESEQMKKIVNSMEELAELFKHVSSMVVE